MAKKKSEKVTKTDAVRAAVKEGLNDNQEIASYAKEKFGLDVTPEQVSTYKSLDKKRAAKAEGNGKPEAKPEVAPMPRAVKTTKGPGDIAGNGSPAALAMAVKQLVAQHGAEAVREMTKVFEGN